MARESIFGRWLIDLATTNPPPCRDQWARAMRAEFEALEGRRTGWALGCLATSVGWRLRANWGFLLAFFAVAICLEQVTGWAQFYLLIWLFSWIPRDSLHDTLRMFFYATDCWGVLAVASACFAAVRPRLWPAIGIGIALISEVSGLLYFVYYFHKPISFIPRIHIMDAQIDVGIGACIGYSLLGALIGSSLGGMFRRGAPKSSALA